MLFAEIARGRCHDCALRYEKLTSRFNREPDVFLADELQRLGGGVARGLADCSLNRLGRATLKATRTEELIDLLDQNIGSNADWLHGSGRRHRERTRGRTSSSIKPAD